MDAELRKEIEKIVDERLTALLKRTREVVDAEIRNSQKTEGM